MLQKRTPLSPMAQDAAPKLDTQEELVEKLHLSVEEAAEGSSGLAHTPIKPRFNTGGESDEEFWDRLARDTGGTWK